jgi:D-tyrosyl-tRNA(Tyr) deacylase
MIALLQRVTSASVSIECERVAEIGHGLMVLVGIEKNDDAARADRLVERILGYRVFADDDGRMNLNVRDVDGAVLLVPQFTLAADTGKGMRPSFSGAADPEIGCALFTTVVDIMQRRYERIKHGVFGANMAVELVNDGPVTFWLRS